MRHVQVRCQVSERRACRVLGFSRSTARYASKLKDDEVALTQALEALRLSHPQWGYRKLTALLREQGWKVNPKRIYRIWREQGWQKSAPVSRKRKASGQSTNACHVRKATQGNQAWAVDFVQDHTRDGKPFRILTVIDEYTREVLALEAKRSMKQDEVEEVLSRLVQSRGAPAFVRSNNGGEFSGQQIQTALTRLGTQTALIAPGSPWQNGKNERLNGILSQELLSKEVWASVLEAHVMCQQWMQTYNELRPHGSLKMKTPSSFAQEAKQQGCWYHPH